MFLKNSEIGRSMVEMLGVLAIMGVLTLGGIAGFRSAMQRFRANGIAGLIAEMSVEAQTRNKCIDFDDLDDDWGLPECVESVTGAGNGQVQLTFKEGSECQAIQEMVKNTFGQCKVEIDNTTLTFYPNRGQSCNASICSGCESAPSFPCPQKF